MLLLLPTAPTGFDWSTLLKKAESTITLGPGPPAQVSTMFESVAATIPASSSVQISTRARVPPLVVSTSTACVRFCVP